VLTGSLEAMIDEGNYLPHGVPARPLGLRVLEYIEASYSDGFCSEQMRDFHIEMPMQPRPILVTMSDWRLRELVI
jgi:hypothetical protein